MPPSLTLLDLRGVGCTSNEQVGALKTALRELQARGVSVLAPHLALGETAATEALNGELVKRSTEQELRVRAASATRLQAAERGRRVRQCGLGCGVAEAVKR